MALKEKLNIQTIDIDISKDLIKNREKLKSLDSKSRYKRFRFFDNNLLLQLKDLTVTAYMIKPDGKEIYNSLTVNTEKNYAELEFTTQALIAPGELKMELVLAENDVEISSFILVFNVIESLRSNNSIESCNEYTALYTTLKDIKKVIDGYNNLYSNWDSKFKDKYLNVESEYAKDISEMKSNLVDKSKYVTGNNIVSETTNGYIQDLKLKGKTVVNVLPKLSKLGFGMGGEGTVITNNINGVFSGISSNYNYYVYDGENIAKVLYPNSQYTVKGFIEITCTIAGTINIFYISLVDGVPKTRVIKSYKLNIGKNYIPINEVFTTDDLCNGTCGFYTNNIGTINDLKFMFMMLQGDVFQLNINSHIEGIVSVANINEIEVSSVKSDGNLININDKDFIIDKMINESGNLYDAPLNNTSNYIINKGVNTYIIPNGKDSSVGIAVYDFNKKFIKTKSLGKGTPRIFTIEENGYFRVTLDAMYEMKCFKGSVLKPYQDYKGDKKTILFKDNDNQWKPVTNLPGYWENEKFVWGDTIELHSDMKYYLHVRTITAKGADLIGLVKEQNFSNKDGYYGFLPNKEGIKLSVPDKSKPYIICDKLKPVGIDIIAGSQYSDVDCISYDTRYQCVRLTVQKGTDINKYLSEKNISFILPIDEKVYECLDISVRSFKNETMLSINGESIEPEISYYVPTGFLSADNSISEKLNSTDKYLEENIKSINNYFNINRGNVTNFNTATKEGKYIVGSTSDIPHAPYVDPGMGIYGILEVLYKGTECIQRFTSNINKMFVRFRNYKGDWSDWNRATSDKDFHLNIDSQDTGFQMLPSGFTIQWGRQNVSLNNTWAVGGSIKFPITFKSIKNVQAIICDSNFDDPIHGRVSVRRNTGGVCSEVPFTLIDSRGVAKTGVYAFDWIAIGLV